MTTGLLLVAAGWMLVGTLVTETRSVAIVESGSGAQQVLRLGDTVDNCVVNSITRDEVSLGCATDELRLALQASSETARFELAAVQPRGELHTIPDEAFRALLTDRQQLMSQISLEPAVADGILYGYRIASITKNGAFADLGLTSGDVITHVNGAAAKHGDLFIQTVDALDGHKSFSIEVDRRGQKHELVYLLE